MAFIPPSRDFAFQATGTHSQGHAEASSSRQVAEPLAPLDLESGSVDVTYQVVWTAGEPPTSHPPRLPQVRTADWPQPPWSQVPAFVYPPRVSGSVHIIGSPPGGSVWGRLRKEGKDYPGVEMLGPLPNETIPCMAMLDRGTLGALSTCLFNVATDSFEGFSADYRTWAHNRGYHDYGDVKMSMKKWVRRGSPVSVEDDNKNDFLFLMVDKDHGITRVWRPNLVAKRVIGVGETKLTDAEFMRLGLDEDDEF